MFEVISVLSEVMTVIQIKNTHLLIEVTDNLLDLFHLLLAHVVQLRVQA